MASELSMNLYDNISNDVPRTPIICFYHYNLIDDDDFKNHHEFSFNLRYHKGGYYGFTNKLITENHFQELIDKCSIEQIDDMNMKCFSIDNIKNFESLYTHFDYVWLMLLPNYDCITMIDLFFNNKTEIEKNINRYVNFHNLLGKHIPKLKEKENDE